MMPSKMMTVTPISADPVSSVAVSELCCFRVDFHHIMVTEVLKRETSWNRPIRGEVFGGYSSMFSGVAAKCGLSV